MIPKKISSFMAMIMAIFGLNPFYTDSWLHFLTYQCNEYDWCEQSVRLKSPFGICNNKSLCQSFIAQLRRIHFNSSSKAVFSRLTAIGKDFKVVSRCTTIKLSFLLVHVISGRNEVDLRLKCALLNLEFLASHSPCDLNLLWQNKYWHYQ